MPDQANPATTPSAKWWASSVTLWGAVATAISTVLPPELAQQLGDQVIVLAQAAGGVAGTILTIYGRVRATTALARRQLTFTM
jgi:hypothetical protein